MQTKSLSIYAAPILRIGMALVFLWFGTSQLMNPQMWTIWVPDWIVNLAPSAEFVVYSNGILEIILGIMLLLGFWTRIVAAILAVHLAGIVLSVGYTATGVRDFGLTIATAAVALHGNDAFTLQEYLRKRKA